MSLQYNAPHTTTNLPIDSRKLLYTRHVGELSFKHRTRVPSNRPDFELDATGVKIGWASRLPLAPAASLRRSVILGSVRISSSRRHGFRSLIYHRTTLMDAGGERFSASPAAARPRAGNVSSTGGGADRGSRGRSPTVSPLIWDLMGPRLLRYNRAHVHLAFAFAFAFTLSLSLSALQLSFAFALSFAASLRLALALTLPPSHSKSLLLPHTRHSPLRAAQDDTSEVVPFARLEQARLELDAEFNRGRDLGRMETETETEKRTLEEENDALKIEKERLLGLVYRHERNLHRLKEWLVEERFKVLQATAADPNLVYEQKDTFCDGQRADIEAMLADDPVYKFHQEDDSEHEDSDYEEYMNPEGYKKRRAARAQEMLPEPPIVPAPQVNSNKKKKKKNTHPSVPLPLPEESTRRSPPLQAAPQQATAPEPAPAPAYEAADGDTSLPLEEEEVGPALRVFDPKEQDGDTAEELTRVAEHDARRARKKERAKALGKVAGDTKIVATILDAAGVLRTLAEVRLRAPSYEELWHETNGLQLPMPLGKYGQPHLPGWLWGDIHPSEIFKKSPSTGRIDTSSEKFRRLAGEAEMLPFAARSAAQRAALSIAIQAGVPPIEGRKEHEPDVAWDCRTNPYGVPLAVRRVNRVARGKSFVYTDWDAIDFDNWLMHRVSRPKYKRDESGGEADWINAVMHTLAWAQEQHATNPWPASLAPYKNGPSAYQGAFGPGKEKRVFNHLRQCGFALERLITTPERAAEIYREERENYAYWEEFDLPVRVSQDGSRYEPDGPENEVWRLETEEERLARVDRAHRELYRSEFQDFLFRSRLASESRRRVREMLMKDEKWATLTQLEQTVWVDARVTYWKPVVGRPLFRTKEILEEKKYAYMYRKRDGVLLGRIPLAQYKVSAPGVTTSPPPCALLSTTSAENVGNGTSGAVEVDAGSVLVSAPASVD
ncbi:hypothetical protein EXIGLDRAFT_696627 [Exidia glandulosa HHB12029]|uniref:Uncharacterized protein n=1 Tax=Exidia glandulosa HHB12029 TaxID=1314781 RepID=A0A165F7K5_EXIGL|nr:hypothetical protein EXIGLDRAFT_696627 [Exidia glandulosa HHB12029]